MPNAVAGLNATDVPVRQASFKEPRVCLDYLDGLRGLAAMFAVFHHAYVEMLFRFPGGQIPPILTRPLLFLGWGHFRVDAFIVLSGYVLTLPVARHPNGELAGGAPDFLKRRARRILPPYYAALTLSLLLIALVPSLRYATSADWNRPLVAFTPGILISHLLLVHNLSPAWIYRIDLPVWSLPTEWQIYFLFPLLVPFWKRFGTAALIGASFVLGLVPHFLIRSENHLDAACFWYIGLFALGMTASAISFSRALPFSAWRAQVPWGILAALPFAALLAFGLHKGGMSKDVRWITDPIVGFAVAALLIYCTRFLTMDTDQPQPMILKVFAAPWCVTLGTFSYSLYLVHYPILALGNTLMARMHVQPVVNFLVSLFVVAPSTVGFAYLFHLAFEKRFTRSRSIVRACSNATGLDRRPLTADA